jgi:seryl-tRNA synthetase
MLDINLFRVEKGGKPDLIKASQRKRGASVEEVDTIIQLDKEWVKRTAVTW